MASRSNICPTKKVNKILITRGKKKSNQWLYVIVINNGHLVTVSVQWNFFSFYISFTTLYGSPSAFSTQTITNMVLPRNQMHGIILQKIRTRSYARYPFYCLKVGKQTDPVRFSSKTVGPNHCSGPGRAGLFYGYKGRPGASSAHVQFFF